MKEATSLACLSIRAESFRGFGSIQATVLLVTPIVDPNDTAGFTEGRGINNSGIIAGDYINSEGTVRSFFLSDGTFTEYDIAGAVETNLLSINEAGDFTGEFDPDGSGVFQGFISVGGTLNNAPASRDALSTFAYQINNSKLLTVGCCSTASSILHGFFTGIAPGCCISQSILRVPLRRFLFGINNRSLGGGQVCGQRRCDSWTVVRPAGQLHNFRFSRVNLHIAERNQFGGKNLWSLRRCFGHCPRVHRPRQELAASEPGERASEGGSIRLAGHSP